METVGVFLAALLTLAVPEETAKVGYYQLPVIAGVWQIELENVDKAVCQERYHFGRLGKLSTSSAGEITQGQYHFSYVEDNQVSLPILAMHTLYDNNAPDCQGNQVNQTGERSAFFVKLDNRHNPTVMRWCNDGEGHHCPMTLWRVLP